MWSVKDQRPVWAEVDYDALAHNIREVRRLAQKTAMVTAVVKADAYGHGAVECAKIFLKNGADRLAVAALSEAIELRKAGYEVPIMVLGYTPKEQFVEALKFDIILTIYEEGQGIFLSQVAGMLGRKATIHVKIDTGMHRIGMAANEKTVDSILRMAKLESIYLEGMFTHFACADSKDKSCTKMQFEKYMWVCTQLEEKGLTIPIKHTANSATIIDLPEYHLDMVRAGIMLYGLHPSDEVQKEKLTLKPAMTLKARVTHVKTLEKGSGISYSYKYVTQGEEQIASIPVGYADGYTRILNGKGAYVGIHGESAPIVGSICMDQCMFQVSHVDNVQVEDEVRLFGNGTEGEPHTDEVAAKLGTINYEIVCMIARRVPRVYVENKKIVMVRDYLLD